MGTKANLKKLLDYKYPEKDSPSADDIRALHDEDNKLHARIVAAQEQLDRQHMRLLELEARLTAPSYLDIKKAVEAAVKALPNERVEAAFDRINAIDNKLSNPKKLIQSALEDFVGKYFSFRQS